MIHPTKFPFFKKIPKNPPLGGAPRSTRGGARGGFIPNSSFIKNAVRALHGFSPFFQLARSADRKEIYLRGQSIVQIYKVLTQITSLR